METLFLRFFWVSLTCSAVLLPLLLAKSWLRRRVRAKTLYLVWLALALRLALPVDFSLPEPAVILEDPGLHVALSVPAPVMTVNGESPWAGQDTRPQTEEYWGESPRVPVTALLALAWGTGAAGLALVQGGGYLLARRRLLKGARPDLEAEEQVGQAAANLGLKRAVPVRRSGAISTPMVVGPVRPVLLLPLDFKADELVLCHELTHVKRRDLLCKALLTAVCWLHWFNPMVWLMNRAASENLELCCDDDVAAGQDAAFRRRYGELLLSTAEGQKAPALSSQFGGRSKTMKERLTNLFSHKKRSRLLLCAALAALLLLGGLTACEGQPALSDQEALDTLNESIQMEPDNQALTLSFTLPEGERDWDLQLIQEGRSEEVREISEIQAFNATQWVPGKSYSFRLPWDALLDIQTNLDVSLNGGRDGFSISLAAGSLSLTSAAAPTARQEAVDTLEASLFYDGSTLSFTLPEGEGDWSLQIAGRAETEELGSMSLHFLDGTDWAPGETYSFDLSPAQVWDLTELSMWGTLDGQEWEINLLAHLNLPVHYELPSYGFTLTLPDRWYSQVEIRRDDQGLPGFYLRDAGDFEGAGLLFAIHTCTPEEWTQNEANGNPAAWRHLADLEDEVLYAQVTTDLPVDPAVPRALERYTALSQGENPLDSFTLTGEIG